MINSAKASGEGQGNAVNKIDGLSGRAWLSRRPSDLMGLAFGNSVPRPSPARCARDLSPQERGEVREALRSAIPIHISNSYASAFPRLHEPEPCCGPTPKVRGGGTPKGAPLTRRGVFPGSPGNRGTRQRLPALRRGVLKPWSVLPGTWLDGDFAPPPVPVQPASVAEPRSGPGRKPRASRVRGCKPQPRAPHPTGLGYPAPAKLSLCPASKVPSRSAPSPDRARRS